MLFQKRNKLPVYRSLIGKVKRLNAVDGGVAVCKTNFTAGSRAYTRRQSRRNLLSGFNFITFFRVCPRLVPHVLPATGAGVIFHPAAAALVAAVNIFRHMGVIVSTGQSAAPFAAVALSGADDPGPQPALP